MNNYIIIDADKIKQKIEELKKANEVFKHSNNTNPTSSAVQSKLATLQEILSNSILLIPEIEKAFIAGTMYQEYFLLSDRDEQPNLEDHISQLKLNL